MTYWGLRDYGTASWEGGDAECDHKPPPSKKGDYPDSGRKQQTNPGSFGYREWDACGKCGAKRVDRQIGLEPTPEAWLDKMVAVFREVRRVLRPDGTVWLNVGSSYSSSTIFSENLILREDLSGEDKAYVAMEMFGLRVTGDEASGEGDVPSVLPQGIHKDTDGGGPSIPGERVEGELPEKQGTPSGKRQGTQQEAEVGSDKPAGWSMRLLRRDGDGISDSGSCKRRRRRTQKGEPGTEREVQQCEDLQGHTKRGISDQQIQSPVFQLQLLHRLLGILSTHTFSHHEIPDSVRFAFAREVIFKPKDLIDIPGMLAHRLQADGWYLRSNIAWCKKSAMPESVTDRPTSAWEHIWLLSKAARYYYDAEAVRVAGPSYSRSAGGYADAGSGIGEGTGGRDGRRGIGFKKRDVSTSSANLRNYWLLGPEPFPDAHFATFPTEIPRRCIKAGTSQKGACAACGAPWERVVERASSGDYGRGTDGHAAARGNDRAILNGSDWYDGANRATTTGWTPTCSCNAEVVPCTVIDIFSGAGTTGVVCVELDRKYIGIELNPEYARMSEERIARQGAPQMGLAL